MTKVFSYSLSIIQPIELEKGTYVLNVPKAGQYKINFIVEYVTPTPCKFFANLYPDARDRELHSMGAHFDTVNSYGAPVSGKGELVFTLCSMAPSPSWFQNKKFPKQIAMGLMDYDQWMTKPPFCMREDSFTLKTI